MRNFCVAYFCLAKSRSDIYLTIWHEFCDIQASCTDCTDILLYTFCLLLILFLILLGRRWKDEYLGRIRESTSSGRLPSWCYVSCCITNLVVWSLCESRPRLRTILVVVSLFIQGCCSDVLYVLHNQVIEKLHFNWAHFLYNLCVLKISKCRQY